MYAAGPLNGKPAGKSAGRKIHVNRTYEVERSRAANLKPRTPKNNQFRASWLLPFEGEPPQSFLVNHDTCRDGDGKAGGHARDYKLALGIRCLQRRTFRAYREGQ